MGMGNMAAMMGAARSGNSRPSSSNYNVARAPAPTPEVGAKQPGKLRVGVAALQDKSGKTKLDGDALRSQLIAKLQRFGFDVVPADGADDEQVTADAKKKDCDYLVFTDVTARDAPSVKKIGGFLGRRITGIGGGDSVTSFEGSVNYRLFKMADMQPDKPELEAKQDTKGSTPDEAITPTFEHESRDVAQQIAKDKRGG